jgi:hypothetical protein
VKDATDFETTWARRRQTVGPAIHQETVVSCQQSAFSPGDLPKLRSVWLKTEG